MGKLNGYYFGVAHSVLREADAKLSSALMYLAEAKNGNDATDLNLIKDIEKVQRSLRQHTTRMVHIMSDSDFVENQ